MSGQSNDEVWVLLAKYLFDEATPDERMQAESLLDKDQKLRTYFQELQTVFFADEHNRIGDPVIEFSKLHERIQKSANDN